MPSPNRYEITEYELTGDPDVADHNQHYGPKMQRLLQQTHQKVQKAKGGLLPELLKLVKQYPHIPAFKNYLSSYYQLTNQPEKAYAINRQVVEEHPEYLHGQVNLAAEYLAKEAYEKVPQILGEALDIKARYPQRKVFHHNEFEVFNNVVCRYLIAVDRLEEAEERIKVLEEIATNPDLVTQLRIIMAAKRLEKMGERMQEKADRRKAHPIGKSYDKDIQTDEPPQLHHPELQALYQNGMRIQAEVLKELLTLPRETLVEDLRNILWDSVRRYEHFQREMDEAGWDEDRFYFPLHALFLLTELRAVEALPLLLDCLRQGENYLEFWYGDHLFETWWHFIYHLGREELEQLQAFMQGRDIHYMGKNVVSQAVEQIGLHQPERRETVLGWYEAIFRHFLDHQEDDLLIDIEIISFMIGEVTNLRGERLLPLIQQFFELKLVDTFIVGKYEEVELAIKTAKIKRPATPVFADSLQHYQHIITTWHGYQTEEQRAEQKLAWQKRLAEIERSEKQGSTPSFTNPAPVQRNSPKVGRNDPCPCGSGKKHKRCCWGK